MTETGFIQRIISGGQTGVDRAALDVAMELGIPCGGWCPKGRLAVDGVIPSRYPLRETQTADYAERTRLNVVDSDGTLILNVGELTGGTAYTAEVARQNAKPYIVVQIDVSPDPGQVINWIAQHSIHALNVAGPREDNQAGIHALASNFLIKVLQRNASHPS